MQSRVGIESLYVINYAAKNKIKMNLKIPYYDQIKFNAPVLNPGTPE